MGRKRLSPQPGTIGFPAPASAASGLALVALNGAQAPSGGPWRGSSGERAAVPTPPPAPPETPPTAAEAGATDFHRRYSKPAIGLVVGRLCERFGQWSRTMRVLRRVPLIVTAFIAIASSADAECLSSAESVLVAHHGSHAIWTRRLPGHIGEKCWFASSDETQVIHADDSRDDARQIRPMSAQAPLPRPRSQDVAARAPVTANDSRDVSREIEPMSVMASPPASATPDSTGGARSILIWGRPMDLDAAWEEIFTKRERTAK
jgi:hypothetical protein